MPLDDSPRDSQSDSCAIVLIHGMQALEHLEDAILLPHRNANSIVLDLAESFPALSFGGDMNLRSGPIPILDRISNGVLNQHCHLRFLGYD